jgi:chromosome partitioning protein
MSAINKEAFLHKAFVIYNDKGGVGKSAMSINITFAIMQMTGLKGQLVDTDPQKTSATCMDTRLSMGYETPDYIWRTSAIRANFFKEIGKYQFVVFDTQGADSPTGREIMTFSDCLIIPVNASGFVVNTLAGKEGMLEKVVRAKANNPNLKTFIVFNMVEKKNTAQIRKHKTKVKIMLDELLAKYDSNTEESEIHICETSISAKPALYDKMNDGKSIFEISKGKYLDPLLEYTALLAEIQEKLTSDIEVVA